MFGIDATELTIYAVILAGSLALLCFMLGRLVLGLALVVLGALVLLTPNGLVLIGGGVLLGVVYAMMRVALHAGAHYDIDSGGGDLSVTIIGGHRE